MHKPMVQRLHMHDGIERFGAHCSQEMSSHDVAQVGIFASKLEIELSRWRRSCLLTRKGVARHFEDMDILIIDSKQFLEFLCLFLLGGSHFAKDATGDLSTQISQTGLNVLR